MRAFLSGIIFTVALLVGAGLTLILGGFVSYGADQKPTQVEVWLSTTALNRSIDRASQGLTDPLPTSDENLQAGVKLYGENCAICHGASDGMPSNASKGINVRPPMLAKDGVEDDPEGVTFWKIKHGIRFTAMPSFDGALSDTQMWQLTQFLKHMDNLPPAVAAAWKNVPSTAQSPAPAESPAAVASPSAIESPAAAESPSATQSPSGTTTE